MPTGVSLPDCAPVVVGLNTTPIVHFCPGLSVVNDAQVVCACEMANAPLKFQLSSVIGTAFFLLGLASVTV